MFLGPWYTNRQGLFVLLFLHYWILKLLPQFKKFWCLLCHVHCKTNSSNPANANNHVNQRCGLRLYILQRIFFFFFWLFRAAPASYGSSQARGPIGATAAGLHQPQPRRIQVMSKGNAGSPDPLREARDWNCIIMDTSQICFFYATMGTPQRMHF